MALPQTNGSFGSKSPLVYGIWNCFDIFGNESNQPSPIFSVHMATLYHSCLIIFTHHLQTWTVVLCHSCSWRFAGTTTKEWSLSTPVLIEWQNYAHVDNKISQFYLPCISVICIKSRVRSENKTLSNWRVLCFWWLCFISSSHFLGLLTIISSHTTGLFIRYQWYPKHILQTAVWHQLF